MRRPGRPSRPFLATPEPTTVSCCSPAGSHSRPQPGGLGGVISEFAALRVLSAGSGAGASACGLLVQNSAQIASEELATILHRRRNLWAPGQRRRVSGRRREPGSGRRRGPTVLDLAVAAAGVDAPGLLLRPWEAAGRSRGGS
jgi:fructose-1,6-bisphosphatase/inositol monophosphatase family enzyme